MHYLRYSFLTRILVPRNSTGVSLMTVIYTGFIGDPIWISWRRRALGGIGMEVRDCTRGSLRVTLSMGGGGVYGLFPY